MDKCKICNNINNNKYYKVKELQFGINEEFNYMECLNCGCLQLIDIPEDMSKYYPNNYYSFNIDNDIKYRSILNNIEVNTNKYYFTKKGSLISKLFCFFFIGILIPIKPEKDIFEKKIIDIGCGNGKLLKMMSECGFKYLYGADPYIKNEINYKINENNSIKIYKSDIFDINDKYDIIMLNHSLEHMPRQNDVLKKISNLLNDNGICIIRIPTVSSYAWSKYKEYWFSLDAPRHFFLHSIKSISILCDKCNFNINEILYDSHDGLIRSVLYKRKEWNINKQNKYLYSIFGILPFIFHKIFSKYLNKKELGETIKIILKKKDE